MRTWFQPMCGTFSPCGRRTTRPGSTPKQGCSPPSSLTSNSACWPMHTPRNGRPPAMYSRIGSTSECRLRLRIVSAAAPTPGTISASARSTSRPLDVISGSPPAWATARATLRRFPAP